VDTSYNGVVTVSDTGQPLGGPGASMVNAVDGVATFSGLTLDYLRSALNDESLDVSASGFASVSYAPIVVIPGPAE
jgi:hypothetical protein